MAISRSRQSATASLIADSTASKLPAWCRMATTMRANSLAMTPAGDLDSGLVKPQSMRCHQSGAQLTHNRYRKGEMDNGLLEL